MPESVYINRKHTMIFFDFTLDKIRSAVGKQVSVVLVSAGEEGSFEDAVRVLKADKHHAFILAGGGRLGSHMPTDHPDGLAFIIGQEFGRHIAFDLFPWLEEMQGMFGHGNIQQLHFPI